MISGDEELMKCVGWHILSRHPQCTQMYRLNHPVSRELRFTFTLVGCGNIHIHGELGATNRIYT